MSTSTLRQTLDALAIALGQPIDESWRRALEDKLIEDELDREAPPWLEPFLAALASRTPTSEWVPFEVVGLESSGAFDFVRTLDRVLPVRIQDDGERYTVLAESLGFEAILAFEGYLWLVKPIGAPEPGE